MRNNQAENQLFFANLTIAATKAWEALAFNEIKEPRFKE